MCIFGCFDGIDSFRTVESRGIEKIHFSNFGFQRSFRDFMSIYGKVETFCVKLKKHFLNVDLFLIYLLICNPKISFKKLIIFSYTYQQNPVKKTSIGTMGLKGA